MTLFELLTSLFALSTPAPYSYLTSHAAVDPPCLARAVGTPDRWEEAMASLCLHAELLLSPGLPSVMTLGPAACSAELSRYRDGPLLKATHDRVMAMVVMVPLTPTLGICLPFISVVCVTSIGIPRFTTILALVFLLAVSPYRRPAPACL